MTKKFISIIFAFVLSISSISIFNTSASAATKEDAIYDSEAALSYAEKNWNSGVGLCAEFASRCINAGGIDVFEKRVVDLYNALNGTYGVSNKLTLTGGTRGCLKWSANSSKVSKGDLIFYYCNSCQHFQHVVVCNGANIFGYIQDYAHNKAHNGKKQTYSYTDYNCGSHNWTIYAIDLYESPKTFGKKTDVEIPEVTSVANAGNGIKVKWSTVNKADKYNIYRKTATSNWQKLSSVTGTSFTDKTSQNGVRYYYTVRAVDNNTLSQYFAGKSVIALSAPTVSAYNQANGIKLQWSEIRNADGYYVYKAVGKAWVKIAKVTGQGTTSYIDKNVKDGVDYKYTVKAYDGKIKGAYNTKGVTITCLKAPQDLKSEKSEKGTSISFSKITGAVKYRIYRRASNENSWTTLGYTTSGSFLDTTGVEGVTYSYTTRAYAADSTKSAYSNKPVSVVYTAPVAPTEVKDVSKSASAVAKKVLESKKVPSVIANKAQ